MLVYQRVSCFHPKLADKWMGIPQYSWNNKGFDPSPYAKNGKTMLNNQLPWKRPFNSQLGSSNVRTKAKEPSRVLKPALTAFGSVLKSNGWSRQTAKEKRTESIRILLRIETYQ